MATTSGATPNPLTYNGLITQVCLLAPYQYANVGGVVTPTNQPEFTALIPQMLNYAEQRIQRDLDLQATRGGAGDVYTAPAGGGGIVIPFSDFVTLETVLVFHDGQYFPMSAVSLDYLYAVGGPPGPPSVFAMAGGFTVGNQTGTVVIFGPGTLDKPYPIYVYGTLRLPSLATFGVPAAAGSATTWISTWLPDLLVMACMIYVAGYQRDFGRQSDDPQLAQSYENQYQLLLQPIDREESKKRFEADAWTSRQASAVATPTRT